MLIIGERINGMYRSVGAAIRSRDKGEIQQLARAQMEAGAQMLDLNVGPATANPTEAMEWLVEVVQEVIDISLCIDSSRPEVIEAGLKACKGKAMINSTTGQREKLEGMLLLAVKYEVPIISLAMDERGIPRDAAGRCEIALQIIAATREKGIPLENLYLDPLILPLNVTQPTAIEVLEAIKQFKVLSDPPPKTIIGLSNVSQGAAHRELINRTYLVMAMAAGLDAAIMDPLDRDLMEAMITAEVLLNRSIYRDSYLEVYRKD